MNFWGWNAWKLSWFYKMLHSKMKSMFRSTCQPRPLTGLRPPLERPAPLCNVYLCAWATWVATRAANPPLHHAFCTLERLWPPHVRPRPPHVRPNRVIFLVLFPSCFQTSGPLFTRFLRVIYIHMHCMSIKEIKEIIEMLYRICNEWTDWTN